MLGGCVSVHGTVGTGGTGVGVQIGCKASPILAATFFFEKTAKHH